MTSDNESIRELFDIAEIAALRASLSRDRMLFVHYLSVAFQSLFHLCHIDHFSTQQNAVEHLTEQRWMLCVVYGLSASGVVPRKRSLPSSDYDLRPNGR